MLTIVLGVLNKFTSKNGAIIAKKNIKTCISKTMFLLMESLTIVLRTLVSETHYFSSPMFQKVVILAPFKKMDILTR